MIHQEDDHLPDRFPTVAETSFDEAVSSFRQFLDSLEATEPIIWTFVEDVLSTTGQQNFGSPFWLKLPNRDENQTLARCAYTQAQERGFGVGLVAFGKCSAGLCCAVLAPKNDVDAQYSMLGPLRVKLSLFNELRTAREVKSPLLWKIMKFLRFRFREGINNDNIPSKGVLKQEKARIN